MPSRFPPRLPEQRGRTARGQAFPGSISGKVRNASPVRRRRSAPKQTNPAGGGGSWCRFTATAVGDEAGADLGVVPIENSESVFINGLLTVAYSLAGSVVTFDYALTADDIVTIFYQSATSCGVGSLVDGTPPDPFVVAYGYRINDITPINGTDDVTAWCADLNDASDATYAPVTTGGDMGIGLPTDPWLAIQFGDAVGSPTGGVYEGADVVIRARGSGVTLLCWVAATGDLTIGTLSGSFADYTVPAYTSGHFNNFYVVGDGAFDVASITWSWL
jgi:hypothetical protein